MPLLISSRLGSFFGTSGKLSRRRWPLLSKKLRYFSRSSFKPVHCIRSFSPQSFLALSAPDFYAVMAEGQTRRKKQKQPLIPIKGRRLLAASKLRGTTQIAKDHLSPAAFGALTLRSVRFAFAGSSGVARNGSRPERLAACGRSLWTVVCAFLTPSLPSVIISHHTRRALSPFAYS